MKITAQMLRAKGACEEDVEIFEAEWPKGTRVTLKACTRAVELDLSLAWAVTHLLSGAAQKHYRQARTQARKAYYKSTSWDADDIYDKAIARAFYEAAKIKE